MLSNRADLGILLRCIEWIAVLKREAVGMVYESLFRGQRLLRSKIRSKAMRVGGNGDRIDTHTTVRNITTKQAPE